MSMKNNLDEANKALEKFSKDSPEQFQCFFKLMESVEKEGALSAKVKHIIAIAISVVSHCHWCIAFHVNDALKSGASKDEIMEAAWIAAMMGGGPALMYAQLVDKAVDEISQK